MEPIELKPCPKCGKEHPLWINLCIGAGIGCSDPKCGFEIIGRDIEYIARVWNTTEAVEQ